MKLRKNLFFHDVGRKKPLTGSKRLKCWELTAEGAKNPESSWMKYSK
jgi:hypothetical protein